MDIYVASTLSNCEWCFHEQSCKSFCVYIVFSSLVIYLEAEFLSHMVILCLTFCNCVTEKLHVLFYIPTSEYEGPSFSVSLLTLIIVYHCDSSHLGQCGSCWFLNNKKRHKNFGSLSKLGKWVMWHIIQKSLFALDFPHFHCPVLYLHATGFLESTLRREKPHLLPSFPESCSQCTWRLFEF